MPSPEEIEGLCNGRFALPDGCGGDILSSGAGPADATAGEALAGREGLGLVFSGSAGLRML